MTELYKLYKENEKVALVMSNTMETNKLFIELEEAFHNKDAGYYSAIANEIHRRIGRAESNEISKRTKLYKQEFTKSVNKMASIPDQLRSCKGDETKLDEVINELDKIIKGTIKLLSIK